jgi:hypothetical protein
MAPIASRLGDRVDSRLFLELVEWKRNLGLTSTQLYVNAVSVSQSLQANVALRCIA